MSKTALVVAAVVSMIVFVLWLVAPWLVVLLIPLAIFFGFIYLIVKKIFG